MRDSAASMTTVPAIADTKLPATYEAARTAIAECERIDECKTWADKAAAMKAYATMRDDRTLHNLALRIQLRAERRCGELLKQIEPANGARTDLGRATTRGDAAREAGLSDHRRKTALRVAAIPEVEFNRQVESERPPTVTQLAEQGRTQRVSIPDPAAETLKAACSALDQFAKFCDTHDPIETAQAFGADDAEMARRCVSSLHRWLHLFGRSVAREAI
jgi:hypothetical protein